MMEKWVGKIACVTGASSGIGAEICVNLAKSGFHVVGLARREHKINELNDQVNNANGGKVYGKKCDLENESEILEAFAWIKSQFGGLDVFVNNAGIMISNFLIDGESDSFRKLFNVNVIASCIALRESVKLMREKSSLGHIIIINSILGHRIPDVPYPAFGVYPATKYSLTALCQTIRQELSFSQLKIKLTSISPGMVETELLNSINQDLVALLPKLKPSDIADAVNYALSTPEHVRVDEIILNPMN